MELVEILKKTVELNGSDIFIVPGSVVMVKVNGVLVPVTETRVMASETEQLIRQAYAMAGDRSTDQLMDAGDDDFSFALERISRFRCNAYKQRGSYAATLRVVTFGKPDPEKLGIPQLVMELTSNQNGLILVTGPAGSGKTTTLACMVEKISHERSGHIITIEDPIEYMHGHSKSLVSQREVPTDAPTFSRALRAALREAPDVIMLGEMRDSETMGTAITAAETGHLVLSSLHTIGAAKTIDRIIDAFPANQQQQVRIQLSMVLKAVVSQRLVPSEDGKLLPAFEVMTITSAVQNMIRDGKTHQIDNVIYGGAADRSMMSMDNELIRMFREKKISRDTAILYAANTDMMKKRLTGRGD